MLFTSQHHGSSLQNGPLGGVNNFLVQLLVYYVISRGEGPKSLSSLMDLKELTKPHTARECRDRAVNGCQVRFESQNSVTPTMHS